jgi:hypothetical protein
MAQPDITIREKESPHSVISEFNFIQSKDGEEFPVLRGERSDSLFFRIYNNWVLNEGVQTALNINVNIFDGMGLESHTADKEIVSRKCIHCLMNGFGEDSETPGLLSKFKGEDTAIGGSGKYYPELGSDGSQESIIRAGSDENGVGFIEMEIYASIPEDISAGDIDFTMVVEYEWSV